MRTNVLKSIVVGCSLIGTATVATAGSAGTEMANFELTVGSACTVSVISNGTDMSVSSANLAAIGFSLTDAVEVQVNCGIDDYSVCFGGGVHKDGSSRNLEGDGTLIAYKLKRQDNSFEIGDSGCSSLDPSYGSDTFTWGPMAYTGAYGVDNSFKINLSIPVTAGIPDGVYSDAVGVTVLW